MEEKEIKGLIDACFKAKRITENMPKLPKNMKTRHIHVIESIHRLSNNQKEVRISDINKDLAITMPSVTKLIKELENLELIQKSPSKEDKSSTLVTLRPEGQKYYEIYIKKQSRLLNQYFNATSEDIKVTINVINKLLDGVNVVKTKIGDSK